MADSSQEYDANINFLFNMQYAYNSYSASMIDGLVKFATILVFYFVFHAAVMFCVRGQFEKELEQEIMKVDEQIQI